MSPAQTANELPDGGDTASPSTTASRASRPASGGLAAGTASTSEKKYGVNFIVRVLEPVAVDYYVFGNLDRSVTGPNLTSLPRIDLSAQSIGKSCIVLDENAVEP